MAETTDHPPGSAQSRRLAAILAADVAGYTSAMGADEAGTLARVQGLMREVVRPRVAACGGRVFKEMGDGALAEFPSAVGAAECAAAIQRAVPAGELRLRIGLHVGDVIVEGEDIFGDGVNIAARLQAEAEPGEVVASDAFRRHAEGRAGLAFSALGTRRLKGVAEPVALWRLGGEAARRRRPWLRRAALAAGLAGVAALGALWGLSRFAGEEEPGGAARAAPAPAVAVLPFESLSPDPEQAYFAEGLADELITSLTRIEGIRVISRTSSFAIRGRARPAAEIAAELNVRYLVDGSVRRAGERLRITASLVDAEDDTPVWAERFEGAAGDVFGFQDRITGEIIAALRSELTPTERRALARGRTADPAAYDAYLRGLRLVAPRKLLDAEANERAQEAFEEAIRRDPDFALAHAGLAWAKWLHVEAVNQVQSPSSAFELAERSLAIADNALAHRTLAKRHFAVLNPYLVYERRPERALEELEAARQLQPGDPGILADLALVLPFVGRPREALETIRQAMELNPNHPRWYYAASGIAYLLSGEAGPAARDLGRWSEAEPSVDLPYLFLAAAHGLAGDRAKAAEAAERYRHLGGDRTIAAVERRWPMRPAEREVFRRGLEAAGLPESAH